MLAYRYRLRKDPKSRQSLKDGVVDKDKYDEMLIIATAANGVIAPPSVMESVRKFCVCSFLYPSFDVQLTCFDMPSFERDIFDRTRNDSSDNWFAAQLVLSLKILGSIKASSDYSEVFSEARKLEDHKPYLLEPLINNPNALKYTMSHYK